MQPNFHHFFKIQAIDAYKNNIAIGSLNNLKTNIECIRWDVRLIANKAIGGTWVKKIILFLISKSKNNGFTLRVFEKMKNTILMNTR